MTVKMEHHTARKYSSPTRERQASQTRTNILDATQRLLMDRGYAKTTIMLTERLYELCDRSLETANVHEALRLTAQLVLQVHESRSPVFDLLRGAGVLDPELARIENESRCCHRSEQEMHVRFLLHGRRLKDDITMEMALDVFWCLTGRDVYRMLVQERGWSGETYAKWLYEMLVCSLLSHSEVNGE